MTLTFSGSIKTPFIYKDIHFIVHDESEKRNKEETDVRDNQLWNIPNVRQKFYIPDICALFIHIHMREMYQS